MLEANLPRMLRCADWTEGNLLVLSIENAGEALVTPIINANVGVLSALSPIFNRLVEGVRVGVTSTGTSARGCAAWVPQLADSGESWLPGGWVDIALVAAA